LAMTEMFFASRPCQPVSHDDFDFQDDFGAG
jgi:hypothetical protein